MNKLSYDLQHYLFQQLESDSDFVIHLVCREVCHTWGQVDVTTWDSSIDEHWIMLLIEYYIHNTGDTSILHICPNHKSIKETSHHDIMSDVLQLGDLDMLRWIKEIIAKSDWSDQAQRSMWELSFCKPEFIKQCLTIFDLRRTDIVQYLHNFICNGSGEIVKWIVDRYELSSLSDIPIDEARMCIGYAFSSSNNPDDEVTKYIAHLFQFQYFDVGVYLKMAINRESILPWLLDELIDRIDLPSIFHGFHFIAHPIYNSKSHSLPLLIKVYNDKKFEFDDNQVEKLYLLALQRFQVDIISFLHERFSALLKELDKKKILQSLSLFATNYPYTVKNVDYFSYILTFHGITDRDLLTGNGRLFLDICEMQHPIVAMLMQTYDFIFPHPVKQILAKKYPNLA